MSLSDGGHNDDATGSDGDENDKVIVRGTDEDDLPEEFWDEIEAGKPSELAVMKEVGFFFTHRMAL